MTDPIFIIETDTFNDGNPEKMGDVLTARGVKWSYARYVPIAREIEFVKPAPNWHRLVKKYVKQKFDWTYLPTTWATGDFPNVVFYGSLNAAKYLQREQPWWKPGVWMDLEKLRCQTYYAHYGESLVSQNYAMVPVEELYRSPARFFDRYGRDNQVFIRPDENDKPFNGEIVCREKLDEWYEYTSKYDPCKNPYKLAVVSEPVKITQEWRLVLLNGKVVTGSQYRKFIEGWYSVEWEEGYSTAVADFAEHVATKWTPHPLFVMDVALTADGLRLVEVGSVNTCGLYCCDIEKVVDAMIAACK